MSFDTATPLLMPHHPRPLPLRPLLNLCLCILVAWAPALHAQGVSPSSRQTAMDRCVTQASAGAQRARTTEFTSDWKAVSCLADGPHAAELAYAAPDGWEIDHARLDVSKFLDVTQTPPVLSQGGKSARGAVACKQVMSKADEAMPHNNDLAQPGRARLVGVLVETREAQSRQQAAARALCEKATSP